MTTSVTGSVPRAAGATGSDAGRRLRIRRGQALDALLVVGVFLLALPVCVRLPWDGDLGVHLATALRAAASPGAPVDPLTGTTESSPYYSPLTIPQGLFGRLTGLSAHAVVSISAACFVLVLAIGVVRLTRCFTDRLLAPALAMALLVGLWGWQLFDWSGFPSLNSLALGVGYPSTAALALTLNLWAWCRRRSTRDGGARPGLWLSAMGACLGVILLIHQFTGIAAGLGLAAMACGPLWRKARTRPDRLRLLAHAAGAVVVCAVVVSVWPYYDFWALGGSADALNRIHQPLYLAMGRHYGLALLGVPALALRFRRDRLDPLALLFVSSLGLFAAGGLTHEWAMGRILPAVMLSAQLALAYELLPTRSESARTGVARLLRPVALAVTGVAAAVGLWTQAGVLAFALPGLQAPLTDAGVHVVALWDASTWHFPSAQTTAATGTLMTEDYYMLRVAPAHGMPTVAPAYMDVFLTDSTARSDATWAFFNPATTHAERLATLRRYHVRWIGVPAGTLPSDLSGDVRLVSSEPYGLSLYAVAPAAS
ncbi:hypothetical protein [Streptacidiphilus fuscans]|uniref:Integral membrane protein n=1 Tax=Streptacidiphilus fuscans TaxID=2789292 RepID=A0A931B164_9ACTN|nr:hypothetical protein [Streptacidiphilus fuscans]MBF9066792.1 hypothetical protein [Streptacidiphilus fuscans]